MADGTCRECGRPLPARARGAGRTSVYCSAACRQRAYRARHTPDETSAGLVADIRRQAGELAPERPAELHDQVTALSTTVGRLRRVAKLAHDAARQEQENVTEAAVTKPPSGLDDEWVFAELVEPHRRELRVHCYRMVGSYDDAEDLVQEVLLKAWRNRDGFEGRSTLRAWLYRIATNACLDFLRRNTRKPGTYEPVPGFRHGDGPPPSRYTWLQPYPDTLLEGIPDAEATPDTAAVSRETMELVFLTAIQHLPPRQRAVFILRDVLGWPAADTAGALEMTVASVNSALQRARPTIREHLPRRRGEWVARTDVTDEERAILRRYMDVGVHSDVATMAALLHEDVKLTMPPNPMWFRGRDAIIAFITPVFDPASPSYFGRWRYLPTSANRQPAVAAYVQKPGTTVYRAQLLDVLRIEDGLITEITTFEPHLFTAFGLPPKLPGD